ncbi:MAG: tetratricopeptide repeat protein [Cyanobacteria bacterium SZAS LIN-5]|nr:tetratricopeptide repeat protein [Cyanobacteria bacterium SZAS LIN-5]RTL35693.1 MAG: tetratricopeptide repeat protein [Candidatus Melainabacteria bacterium]
MRSQRYLPARTPAQSFKVYAPLVFGVLFPLYFIGLWVSAVSLLFTIPSPVYLLPYFAFITFLTYLSLPIFIHSCVQFIVQKDIVGKDYEAMDRAYLRALNLITRLHLNHGGVRTFLLAELGRMRLLQGQFDSAESYFLEALASTAKNERSPRINKAILYFNLAGALRRQGLFQEASDRYEMGMKFLHSGDAKTLAFLSFANLSIAALKLEQNELAGAEQCLLKAKELMDRTDLQKAFPAVQKIQAELTCLSSLTLVLLRKGDLDAAETIGAKFLLLAAQHLGAISSLELKTLNSIAEEYIALGQSEKAERFLEIAYAVARDFPFHPDSLESLECYENLLLITNRKAEIADMRMWLRPVADGSANLLTFDNSSGLT